MAAEFSDSPGKRTVRSIWNTPLLRFLHEHFGIRYRYVGLPGSDLIDVKLWEDMIEEVIAFQTLEAPNDEDPYGRRSIRKMRENLSSLSVPSRAYLETLEEVIILGKDFEKTDYKQDKFVTLYNLDFCSEISSKVSTLTRGEQRWRFEALRTLLLDQQRCFRTDGGPGTFILLLTIRNQSDAPKLTTYFNEDPAANTKEYISACNSGLAALPALGFVRGTHAWALKAFVYDVLRKFMSAPNISGLFFPTVKYLGSSRFSPMLHFMVICQFGRPERPAPLYLPRDYLTGTTSVRATNKNLLFWEPEPGEVVTTGGTPDPVQWFLDHVQDPFPTIPRPRI